MDAAVIVLRVVALALPAMAGLIRRIYQGRARPDAEPAPPTHHGNRAPTVFTYGSILLALGVLFVPRTTVPGMGEYSLLVLAAVGLLLMAVGTAIMLWARSTLGHAFSLVPQAGAVPAPITAGPYARVRHPVYSGFIVGLVGMAVAFANWAALVILLVATLPLLIWRAREEERLLTRVFGDKYRLYRERTKMLVPYVL